MVCNQVRDILIFLIRYYTRFVISRFQLNLDLVKITSYPTKSFLRNLFRFVQERAALTLFLFAGLFLLSAWGLKYSRLELDIYDVYDPGFQSSVDLSDMKSFYNDRSQMLVAFHFDEYPSADKLCKLLNWSRRLASYKDVKAITSLWSIRAPKVQEEKVWYPKSLEDPCQMSENSEYVLHNFSDKFFRHLISPSGTKDLVFDISFSGSDSDTSQVQYIIDETEKFVDSDLPGASVDYLGMASFRYHFKKIIYKDSFYNILILLIILLFMRLVYGTWISGALLALTLVGSTVVLYGVLGWIGIPIDILTNNLFLMTAVAGTADFIFVSQYQMKGSYQDSFYELITPCFFTTLTTVIGFISLNSSDLEIIQRFGNGAALGALAEWAMMFIFLPAFLKVIGKDKSWVNPAKAWKIPGLIRLQNIVLPKFAVILCTILMLLSLPSFFFLNDQDSPVKNLPKDHVLRVGYEKFQERFLWQGQVYLYFPELIDEKELSSIMDSIQKNNLVFRAENPQELAEEWTTGLPKLRKELILRELSMTPLWGRYYSAFDTLRVPLYLKEQDLHSLRYLRDDIERICQGKCRLSGQRVVYLEYGEKISRTMIESFAVSIFFVISIIGILLWAKGKFYYFIPVTISALMGPLIILSLIAIFQVPVTLITSIFLAVMVGLAGDNGIHYLLASDQNLEEGIESRSEASLMVTIIMIFGSSMFILQSLLPMKILGILFVSGFLINLMGDLWGLKGLLSKKLD